MTTFALIAEGITDHAALEAILEGHYGEEIDVNPLQPRRDETDRARVAEGAFGGWELVLEYCADHHRIAQALEFNDYLIIQIDTDCGDHPNFGVPLTNGGKDRPVEDLVAAVKAKMIGILGPVYKEKILFCVCVHSLECWLLSLHKTHRTKSCAKHLEGEVGRTTKDYPSYWDISRDFRHGKTVAQVAKANESFALFIATLPTIEG